MDYDKTASTSGRALRLFHRWITSLGDGTTGKTRHLLNQLIVIVDGSPGLPVRDVIDDA